MVGVVLDPSGEVLKAGSQGVKWKVNKSWVGGKEGEE